MNLGQFRTKMCKNVKIRSQNFNFFGRRFRSYGEKKRDLGTFAKNFPGYPSRILSQNLKFIFSRGYMDEIAILKKWKNGTKWSKIPRLHEKNRVFEKSVTKIVTFLKILTPLIFEVKIGPIGFSLLILICLENVLGCAGVILFCVR